MFQRTASKSTSKFALVVAIMACAAALGIAQGVQAQIFPAPDGEERPEPEATPQAEEEEPDILVGTYDTELVFQRHPSYDELMEALTTAQQGMQQAQQEGNQEEAMRVQQQYEQTRNRVIEEFRTDVTETVPEAAEAAGVQVVAVEIIYTGDDVGAKDITDELIEAFGGEVEEPEPLFQMPQN